MKVAIKATERALLCWPELVFLYFKYDDFVSKLSLRLVVRIRR
jgi:hypothetical protein